MSEELPFILVKVWTFCKDVVPLDSAEQLFRSTQMVFFHPCCLVKATANVPHKDFYCVYSRFIVSEGKPNMHHVGVTFFFFYCLLNLSLVFYFAYLSSFLLFLLRP